jgi:hypothetical protein
MAAAYLTHGATRRFQRKQIIAGEIFPAVPPLRLQDLCVPWFRETPLVFSVTRRENGASTICLLA